VRRINIGLDESSLRDEIARTPWTNALHERVVSFMEDFHVATTAGIRTAA
jgi:hypothetical protein